MKLTGLMEQNPKLGDCEGLGPEQVAHTGSQHSHHTRKSPRAVVITRALILLFRAIPKSDALEYFSHDDAQELLQEGIFHMYRKVKLKRKRESIQGCKYL